MRHVLSILSLLCCLLPVSAQDGVPRIDVKVSISPKTAKPGDVVTLTIAGDVHPTYHVYGSLEQTGVVPSFKVDKDFYVRTLNILGN